jgi:hypothetical protein
VMESYATHYRVPILNNLIGIYIIVSLSLLSSFFYFLLRPKIRIFRVHDSGW